REFLLAGLLGFCKADLAHRLNSFARINAPPPNSVDLFRPSLGHVPKAKPCSFALSPMRRARVRLAAAERR
ncbi:MAG: hypothetical protein AB7P37_07345, partial [Ramlibacter sp.]